MAIILSWVNTVVSLLHSLQQLLSLNHMDHGKTMNMSPRATSYAASQPNKSDVPLRTTSFFHTLLRVVPFANSQQWNELIRVKPGVGASASVL